MIRTLKEVVRQVLYLCGWRRDLPHLRPATRAERFGQIYATGVWAHGDASTPGSGAGSSLEATAKLREELPRLIERLGVRSLVDVGCGDFTWMQSIALPCRYVGVDIVPAVIEANTARFGSPKRRFMVCDAVKEPAPEGELALCREILFHLSFEDAEAALRNILAGERRYVAATTDRGTGFNANIASGDFRLLNLERPPFSFPRPIEEIDDSAVAKGRVLGVWDAASLRRALGPSLG
jgi:SAM-dependent methyltransferase